MVQKVKVKKEAFLLQTIGIAGTERGVGVTHLAIMIANYMNAKSNKNTAIVELNQTNAFDELKENYTKKQEFDRSSYSYILSGVTYYYQVSHNKISSIYQGQHECLVIDFGVLEEENEEFLKCNVKILIGNLKPWNHKKLLYYMESLLATDYVGKINYVTKFGSTEDMIQIKNAYSVSIVAVPFEPDPFLIHGCNFEFLDKLLY